MNLIVIAGASTTGKSTLANRLSKDLDIPSFQRDAYKERLYDELGSVPSLKQYAQINTASMQQLFSTIQDAVANDKDLIIESNFLYSQHNEIKKYITNDANVIEIFCRARGPIILKRYTERWKSGERHRGHRDYLWRPIVAIESLGLIHLRYKPLRLSNQTMVVDTSNFSKVDYSSIYEYIKKRLK